MKKIIVFVIMLICLITLSISIINVIKWNEDNKETNKELDTINDLVETKETATGEVVNNDSVFTIDLNSPYWKYVNMNMFSVDFKELKSINNDVKGWIKVNGTNINYPFVQTTDNSYYLDHSFNKSYTQAGWVFLDYRNNINSLNKNTIIYGHNRADESMFGSLFHVLRSEWLNNTDNHIVYLSTESNNTMWQVFSVYRIKTTSDYLYTNFNNDDDYQNFLNKIKDRSYYDFNTNINYNDKIITLSSCYGKYEKTVLHAKLIKIETR